MTTLDLLRHLDSRIKALVSYTVDQPEIKSKLSADTHDRVYFSMAFARVVTGRMLLEFLEIRHDASGLCADPPKTKGTGVHDMKISKFSLAPVDVKLLGGPNSTVLTKFYAASHKLVHLTDDHDFDHDLDPEVNPAISLIVKLLYQHLYKPLKKPMLLPPRFVAVMNSEQPGWDR